MALLDSESHLEIIGLAKDGEEVLEHLHSSPLPDILLLDINMPKKDGIELTAEVKKKYPEVKILILSMHHRSEFVKKLTASGADGYILKNGGKGELLRAIQQIASGEQYFAQEILRDSFKQQIIAQGSPAPLSEREKDVARQIAYGSSTSEIAETLHISTHTVDSHRKNILTKIDGKNSVDITNYALKTGIAKRFDIR